MSAAWVWCVDHQRWWLTCRRVLAEPYWRGDSAVSPGDCHVVVPT